MNALLKSFAYGLCLLSSVAGADGWVLNNPYPESEHDKAIYYTSFSEQPKTLDPAKSYSSNEYQFTGQIYEPVLQYDYLKRPYELTMATAFKMPEIEYVDKKGNAVDLKNTHLIANTIYTIQIKPDIYYQPHPAFAKNQSGQLIYHNLNQDFLDEQEINQLSDFKHRGTRELKADDYIYQIKRLANPRINSPIYGLMSQYIEGFTDFGNKLKSDNNQGWQDLRRYELSGVQKIDDYTFKIIIKGLYPQFQYWLAMPFFAPIPWEADKFYSEPDMDDRNLGFGWYPVGTGPFMLTENNPNSEMILEKNPNYRQVMFPETGSSDDIQNGFIHSSGQKLPLIKKAIYTLEKEAIPRWNKFLQGYYDLSGISADSFDQAIHINRFGEPTLTDDMQKKGIRLTQTDDPTIYYLGFNMLDNTVGGHSKRARKLRQAISIAVNYDENIAIFFNGRGKPAQGPIPPGIFGHLEGQKGINPFVYHWNGRSAERRSLDDARQLMTEAGYSKGIDPKTGRALILHYDVPATGGPDDKAQLNWMRKQFAKIGIALNIRATQYNRFQEKMRSGNAQIFSWGWNADYPDPENFLFLLYGPNSKVPYGGENAANYQNKQFDELFEQMKSLPNNAKRQSIINQMVDIVRRDAPWSFGINSQSLMLSHDWVSPFKPNTISQNTLKYMSIHVGDRNKYINKWNQPVLWPIGLFLFILEMLLVPFVFAYYNRQKSKAARIKQ